MAAKPVERQHELEFAFSTRDFQYLADLVHRESGIVLGSGKKNLVYSRLVRRLRDLGLGSFSHYCDLLRTEEGIDEMGNLINAITTNLTRFFREDHHFRHLGGTVLPEVVARAEKTGERRLRIWSAGCSSGEEPYSIAMTLLESPLGFGRNWDTRILATDLDTNMVRHGMEGVYSAEAVAEVDRRLLGKYFRPVGGPKGSFRAEAGARALITFKQLNLLREWPMKGPFDVIFCRNVIIYFDPPTKAELLRRLTRMLRPDGILYLGHSETILDTAIPLRACGKTIYRRTA